MLPTFDRILITLLLFSVQATNFKVADIQLFEVVTMVSFPYMMLRFRGLLAGRAVTLFAPLILYLLMGSLAVYFLVEFFPPPRIGPLKAPLAISLIRLIQFSLIFVAFNYIWLALKESGQVRWAMHRYVDITVLIAVPTCLSYFLAEATGHLTPLVYDTAHYIAADEGSLGMARARGLFNEGGPYGLSLIASLLVGLLLRSPGGHMLLFKLFVLGAAMIMAQSKGALLCGAILLGFYTLRYLSLRKIALFGVIVILSGSVMAYYSRYFLSSFVGYYKTIENVAENAILIQDTNGDVAYGRLAAFFIAPRMIADNPVLGVGLGNYSLVRNNPKYLGNFPEVKGWDLPGLGVFTLLAEGGLIGFLLLPLSYFLFYRRSGPAAKGSGYLYLAPLLLQAFGVQIYFAYHWLALLLMAAHLESAKPALESLPRESPA